MRILIVEDSPPTRDLLKRALAESGHRVSAAGRVAAAVRMVDEEEFDLAIVDVMLPDGSGIDLCRDLRARGFLAPILFLTARGEVQDRIAGLDAGGDDYLRKPFSMGELRARVRALGRRPAATPVTRIHHGGTVIDFASRRLSREGEDVTITAREWAVLDALGTHLGQVVSRTDVLAAAWPRPGPGASGSLDVIVSRLRQKLGAGDGPRIRTVRGQGFVLEVPA